MPNLTTADYALIVSLTSVLIALGSLVWNVWSKWIYPTPKIRVQFAVIQLLHQGQAGEPPRFLSLTMTNFGPTETTIQHIDVKFKPRKFGDRARHAIVNPIHNLAAPQLEMGPFAGGLPKKLGVGEQFSLYLPFEADSVGRMSVQRLGVRDIFGRFHRAPNKHIRQVRREMDAAFPDAPTPPVKE